MSKRLVKVTKYSFNIESEFAVLDNNFELVDSHPAIQVGYTTTGHIEDDTLEVGKPFRIMHNNRLGGLITTNVIEIFENGFKTKNSYYKIENLDEKTKSD